jgi:phage gp29-like protein
MNFKILNSRYWFQKRESVLGSEHVRLEQMAKFNALYGCDPDKIVAAVTQFNAGTIAPLARIIEAFEQNDDKMKICSMKMKASAARCDYSIRLKEGYEDDARAKAHMETLKRFWSTIRVTNRFKMNETGGIRLLKKHMMDAQSFGYAVHEIIWKPLQNGELSAEFVKLPLWHFENHTGSLRFLKREHDYEGEIMRDGEWLVTSGDGVGIAASICAMAKHLSFQDWLLFSERSGMPIIHGATSAAFGSDQWNNLKAALRSIGRDCRIQTDAETKIELVGSASATNIPYPALVDWADRAIAGLYRGADLSTISKGDGTGASLQGDESAMLEQDACALMGETLHEQIDRFVIRYVYSEEPLAYISIDPVEKPDVDTDIKVDNHLAGLGVKLSKKEALQRYGRAEADDEDDALELQKETPFKPDGIGFANEKREIGKREEGTGKSILDAFSKDSSPVAEAIKELLNDPSKEKAEELLKKLPALLPEDPAMAAVIAEAMAAEFGKTGNGVTGNGEGLSNEVLWLVNEDRKENGQFDFKGSGNKTSGKSETPREKHQRICRETLDAYKASKDHATADDVINGKISIEEALNKGFEATFGGQKEIFCTKV